MTMLPSIPSRPLLVRLWPGVILTAAITLVAWVLQEVETVILGYTVIEALVLAILIGIGWRYLRGLSPRLVPGVAFVAKPVLEFAIVLLGSSIYLPDLLRAGSMLLLAILLVVVIGLMASLAIGQFIGLRLKLAILVAVGNSICGNSAIAAVAPVIQADGEDVASSIALTAVLGVIVVLGLPFLIPTLGLTLYQYGVLAGMTVYAVPQVLAATAPISALSAEIGTLVKLVRVLLLGPVVLLFSILYRAPGKTTSFQVTRFVPLFIIGFVLMALARSTGLLPQPIADTLRGISRWLTVAAMAALGLGVNLRSVSRVGPTVATAVTLSLLIMMIVGLILIHVFRIGGNP